MIDKLYNDLPNYMKTDVLMFRGFKFEEVKGKKVLTDIRGMYYKAVDEETMELFNSIGFIKGATKLIMESDLRKIEVYAEMIAGHKKLINEHLNPRKKEEYLNSIKRYEEDVKHYESQIRRWKQTLN